MHKFSIGTKIQFPTFEMLQEAGWIDNGEYIIHPTHKNIFLSYLQIAYHEGKEVTIMSQNAPGQYSIEEEGLYDDWPLDLMEAAITSAKLKAVVKAGFILCQHCDGGETLEIRVQLDQKMYTKCICTGRSIDDIAKEAFREGYERCADDNLDDLRDFNGE